MKHKIIIFTILCTCNLVACKNNSQILTQKPIETPPEITNWDVRPYAIVESFSLTGEVRRVPESKADYILGLEMVGLSQNYFKNDDNYVNDQENGSKIYVERDANTNEVLVAYVYNQETLTWSCYERKIYLEHLGSNFNYSRSLNLIMVENKVYSNIGVNVLEKDFDSEIKKNLEFISDQEGVVDRLEIPTQNNTSNFLTGECKIYALRDENNKITKIYVYQESTEKYYLFQSREYIK